MSTAKKLIIDNLSNIPDDIQDEFEVMENLYKLLRFRKSQQSVAENEGKIRKRSVHATGGGVI